MKLIPLTKGQFAQVDDEDFEHINQWKWFLAKRGETFYARKYKSKKNGDKSLYMHRVILNAIKGMQVDHKDGNGLNNQRANIRICTHTENQRNRPAHKDSLSKHKGVSWDRSCKKWYSRIRQNSKAIVLGYFNSEIDAAISYNEAAARLHGEFARLNIINNQSTT